MVTTNPKMSADIPSPGGELLSSPMASTSPNKIAVATTSVKKPDAGVVKD